MEPGSLVDLDRIEAEMRASDGKPWVVIAGTALRYQPALTAECRRLRAALEPFAEAARCYLPQAENGNPVVVRLGQLRAARAALGHAEEAGDA